MYVIRERGPGRGFICEDEVVVRYYLPNGFAGGANKWEVRRHDADAPMDAMIRNVDEARRLYEEAIDNIRTVHKTEPAILEIVGCQLHLL